MDFTTAVINCTIFPMPIRFVGKKLLYDSKDIEKHLKVVFQFAKEKAEPSMILPQLPADLTLNHYLLLQALKHCIARCYSREFPDESYEDFPYDEFAEIAEFCADIIIEQETWEKSSYWLEK